MKEAEIVLIIKIFFERSDCMLQLGWWRRVICWRFEDFLNRVEAAKLELVLRVMRGGFQKQINSGRRFFRKVLANFSVF